MTAPTFTLNAIRAHEPCRVGWEKLLASLGKTKADDAPLALRRVYESNGLDDALWCLRALPEEWESRVRLLVCDLVEPALAFVPEGERVSRAYARGEASAEELAAARAAAWDAGDAAWAAARAAAWAAARAAAWATRDAAMAAARAAAGAAARDGQARVLEAWLDAMEVEQ